MTQRNCSPLSSNMSHIQSISQCPVLLYQSCCLLHIHPLVQLQGGQATLQFHSCNCPICKNVWRCPLHLTRLAFFQFPTSSRSTFPLLSSYLYSLIILYSLHTGGLAEMLLPRTGGVMSLKEGPTSMPDHSKIDISMAGFTPGSCLQWPQLQLTSAVFITSSPHA